MKNQNENATISDVTARMREEASILSLLNGQRVGVESVVKKLREFADSIDAASQRERDNAAALREALIRARDMLFAWRRDIPFRAWNEIGETIDKCNAALAAPPRNCDILDWRKAWDFWIAEKHPQKPQTFNEAYRETVSFMDWYMSKSEKEGENNGK